MAGEASNQLDGGVEVETRPGGGVSGKIVILLGVLPNLLIIGGLAGAYFAGLLDPLFNKGAEIHQEAAVAEPPPEIPADSQATYYALPDMLVNLNTGGRQSSYLKLSVSLELADDKQTDHLDKVRPRIVDAFQVYLRELRIEDLSGSAGLQRLREELLYRVNAAARPAVIKDVLFKEMLIQ